ncbi:preprotein translocase, secretion protein SecA subunit [Legionella hackeliae]|nr:preprotein translocase, secretion protein SecA subunit [Legionella hackeliae]
MVKGMVGYFLRKIIEGQIKSALLNDETEKTSLRRWLAIANRHPFNPNCWKYQFANGESLVAYSVVQSNARLEAARNPKWYQKILGGRNYHSKYLCESQAYYKSLFEIWVYRKKFENTALPVSFELRWYHRLISWLLDKINLQWSFTSDDLDEQHLFLKLKENEGIEPDYQEHPARVLANEPTSGYKDTPSIREKYTVARLLDSPQLIFKRMIKPESKSKVEPQKIESPIPTHMQQWLNQLSLHHQVDQFHQHQHQVEQEQKIDKNIMADLQRLQDAQKWVDESAISEVSAAISRLEALNYEASVKWVHALNKRCFQIWRRGKSFEAYHNNSHQLLISDAALQRLLAAKGHIRTDDYRLDLDTLPLGFFLEKDSSGKIFTLKYHEKYREYQLMTVQDAAVRLDTYNPSSEFHSKEENQSCSVTKLDLLKTFEECGIQLKPRQLEFLEQLDKSSNTHRNTQGLYKTSAYAFRALKLIAENIHSAPFHEDKTNQLKHFLGEFIDILEKFSKIKAHDLSSLIREEDVESYKALGISLELSDQKDEYKYLVRTKESYLQRFILHYLKDLRNGQEFFSETQQDALRRFGKFDDNAFRWLGHIEYGLDHHHNFAEISKGLLYFFDYFESLGIDVPACDSGSAGLSSLGGFIHLKHMLDCISLSGGKKNIAVQQLQAKYVAALPRDFEESKSLLKEGYSFVHESMLVGSDRYPANMPAIISKEEFEQLKYGSSASERVSPQAYFRAIYLRFIAYHVDPNYLKEAIEKWEKLTQTPITCWENSFYNDSEYFELMHSNLLKNADELIQYALSLPMKLASHSQEDFSQEKNSFEAFGNQKLVGFEVKDQYEKEHIETLFKKLNLPIDLVIELRPILQRMNELARDYADKSANELEASLKNARKLSFEDQLCLLRETHCRLTCAESTTNPPQGEWLRLEQLIAILIATKKNSLLQIDTSEGKTLIIQFSAILKVLAGKKIDVLTHNESLALEASAEIKKIANYLGIKVAKKGDKSAAILDADILYMDAATAVINDLLAQFSDEKNLPGHRRASDAIIDEIDNVVIDINANTTMQISQGSGRASDDFEKFLMTLNTLVRKDLPQKTELVDKTSQRRFIKNMLGTQLVNNEFYKKISACEEDLDYYISAAISAMQLIKKTHYVVEENDLVIEQKPKAITIPRKVVRIVHKDTTGHVDEISRWGAGVHQCVAAWEKQYDATVEIPGESKVLAEADVALYLQEHYKSRSGLSATLGDNSVKGKIEHTIGSEISVIMPRAIRPLDGKANWPLKTKTIGENILTLPEYNRAYRFPPIYTESRETHNETLLDAVQTIQENNQSCIIFLNTINECDALFDYLTEHGISTKHLQILDDTQDDQSAGQKFRPPESTVKVRAKEPKMITLTTAAGSRGTNFNDVNVGILAKPGSGRVTLQKSGRIARNGQFGVVYEIYCTEDLEQGDDYNTDTNTDPMEHRNRIFTHEKAKESRDLAAIESGKQERQTKWWLQQRYLDYRGTNSDRKHLLDKQWTTFFNQIKSWKEDDVKAQWEQFKNNTKQLSQQ